MPRPDKMVESSPKFGFSLFCDDVRIEMNGKVMVIGIYADQLIVPAFPQRIRVVVLSYLKFPIDSPPTGTKIRIYRDNAILLDAPCQIELRPIDKSSREFQIFNDPTRAPDGETAEPFGTFVITSVLSDFEVTQDCIIRVRFVTDQGTLRAGSLFITAAQPKVSVAPAAPENAPIAR